MTKDEALKRFTRLKIKETTEHYLLMVNREDRDNYIVLHAQAFKLWHYSARQQWVNVSPERNITND